MKKLYKTLVILFAALCMIGINYSNVLAGGNDHGEQPAALQVSTSYFCHPPLVDLGEVIYSNMLWSFGSIKSSENDDGDKSSNSDSKNKSKSKGKGKGKHSSSASSSSDDDPPLSGVFVCHRGQTINIPISDIIIHILHGDVLGPCR